MELPLLDPVVNLLCKYLGDDARRVEGGRGGIAKSIKARITNPSRAMHFRWLEPRVRRRISES